MKNSYNCTQSEDGRTFHFVSLYSTPEGVRAVSKQLLFEPDALMIGDKLFSVTNLALVDVLDDGSLCDTSRSGNGTMGMIFATVGNCVVEFFKLYPNEIVHFRGSDASGLRTRPRIHICSA